MERASTNEYCSTVKFNIVDAREYALNDRQRAKKTYLVKDGDSSINGKPVYARILICPIKETFNASKNKNRFGVNKFKLRSDL